MDYSTGKLIFIFIAAVLLACVASWWLAARYRAAMQRLMSAPAAGAASQGAPVAPAAPHDPPARVTPADNRRAGWHLTGLLIGLSCLMALSSASLQLGVGLDGGALFSVKRVALIALIHLWPVIPALGLLWRWWCRCAWAT